jgi:kynureninase
VTVPHDYLLVHRPEFPILSRKTYLNTCSLGAVSQRTRAALDEFVEQWASYGASAWYETWMGVLADTRRTFARLVNAGDHEVALLPSVSALLSALGSTLDYRARPKVITTALDFPTVHYQWMARVREGAELVVLPSEDGVSVSLEAWEAAIDERTALVICSHVNFTSGYINDIAAIQRLARARGALCLVDAYQGTGLIPTDVKALDVDMLLSGGLKWLLGGPGIVYFYIRQPLIAQMEPLTTGWFANQHMFKFDAGLWDYAEDARRFESGTPPLAAVYAGRAGLQIVNEVGSQRLRERTAGLIYDFIARAEERGWPIRGANLTPAQRAGIVMLPTPDPAHIVKALADRDIIIDYRPGALRYSTYFYNTVEENEVLVAALAELLPG